MAEIFLRLGCGLVGWLLVFSHGLVVAVIPRADCTRDLWIGSLLLAVLALLAAAVLLPAALAWRWALRWCALPALALWVPGVLLAAPLIAPVTLHSVPLCDALVGAEAAGAAPFWQRVWPPLQLLAIAACAARAAGHWRAAPASGVAGDRP